MLGFLTHAKKGVEISHSPASWNISDRTLFDLYRRKFSEKILINWRSIIPVHCTRRESSSCNEGSVTTAKFVIGGPACPDRPAPI